MDQGAAVSHNEQRSVVAAKMAEVARKENGKVRELLLAMPESEFEVYATEDPFPSDEQAPPMREPGDGSEEQAACSDDESERDGEWPILDPQALHGLAGEIVRTIEPHSEADPAALLIHMLAAFGNVIDRRPHFKVGATPHYLNIFVGVVGNTSKGRKGTAWAELKPIFRDVEFYWSKNCQSTGLSTGEGLIWQLRDPIREMKPVKEKGQVLRYEEVITDRGVEDKRLFILESEMARVLSVMGRDGSTLSAVIRQAWDGEDLRVLTRSSAARSTEPHISIIGHISRQELLTLLTQKDSHNGLANRFLWVCVRRARFLPDGGSLEQRDLEPLTRRLADVTEVAKHIGELKRDKRASQFWHEIYRSLSEGQPGLLGAVTSRGETQTMRLSGLYALLDGKATVGIEELQAAYALWRYCEDSARFVFGPATGNKQADKILSALRKSPDGMTRTAIAELFSRNASSGLIQTALNVLLKQKLARPVPQPANGAGRPPERWFRC